MAAVKTDSFVPHNPIFAALDMATHRPKLHVIDRADSDDTMLTFESRAAMKSLSDALLAALQDYEVTSREK